MNTKALSLAVAAALALTVSAGGVAAADHVYSHSAESADELPAAYDLTVVDPDDRLADGQAERALALAWGHDDVQAEFDESESYDVTVQATGEDVTVVIEGDAGEAASADLDLDSETVTDTHSGDQIRSADATDTVAVTLANASDDGVTVSTQDDGETIAVSADDVMATPDPLADAEFDIVSEEAPLSDAEKALLETLVRTDNDVGEHVTDLLDRENESGVEEWTATVRELDDSPFVDDEDAVAVELSYDGTDDAVGVYVNLDDEEVLNVVPVRTLDKSESIDTDNVTIVEDGETVTFEQ